MFREGTFKKCDQCIIKKHCFILIMELEDVMFSGKQTTARKMADQLRTVLIKEHMGFTATAYILRSQYELLTL